MFIQITGYVLHCYCEGSYDGCLVSLGFPGLRELTLKISKLLPQYATYWKEEGTVVARDIFVLKINESVEPGKVSPLY